MENTEKDPKDPKKVQEPNKERTATEQNDDQNVNTPPDQGRASFTTGSTTQGGSNHGQGSGYLAGDAYAQGSAQSSGSDYRNEGHKLGDTAETQGNGKEGGGAAGYDAGKEQQEVNKEREHMHNERDENQLKPAEQPSTDDNDNAGTTPTSQQQSGGQSGQAGTQGITA